MGQLHRTHGGPELLHGRHCCVHCRHNVRVSVLKIKGAGDTEPYAL